MFRVVTAVCPGIVVRSELCTVTVPTLESVSAVSVAVAVALTNPAAAGSLWSAAVTTATLDHRIAGAVSIWAGAIIAGS